MYLCDLDIKTKSANWINFNPRMVFYFDFSDYKREQEWRDNGASGVYTTISSLIVFAAIWRMIL